MRQAFQSQEGVKKLSDEILTQQHTGVEYDEYIEMKKAIEAFAKAVPGTAKRTITDVTDSATAKDAEWANLLLLPTTKVSNLYLLFKLALS